MVVPLRLPALSLASCGYGYNYGYGYGTSAVVTGISPNNGTTAGGTSVTITGCGFTGATGVNFGSNAATFTVNSDTQITATSPNHAAGTVDVTVVNPLGPSAPSPADEFTFLTPGACATGAVTSNMTAPQPRGTTVTFTGTSGGCTSPVYQWWIWGAATGWQLKQAYSATNTFALDTTGLAPGTYSVDVWIERSGQPAGTYETFGLESWVVGGCQSATLSPNPAPTTGIIHFAATASGTGCTSPQFQYWLYSTGTGWFIKQAYSSTSTLDLDTATLANTNYSVVVWVKQPATSSSTYESWALSQIPKGACGATTMSALPSSPQNGGSSVTFTAVADPACVGAQYEYFIYPSQNRAPQWTMLRAFSSSGVFAWDTTGWPTGTYSIDVWVKTTGSTMPYDTYGLIQFSIEGTTSAGLSASPASPHACCSLVTITATSSGVSSPQYQFWLYPGSGGTWQVIQDWSASATATWTPGTTRSYALVVYVRQSGAASGDITWAEISYSAT